MHQPQIKPVQWLAIPNQLHADSTINIHVRGFALSAFHLFQHGSELLVELIKVIEGKVHASNVALDSFQIFFELFFCHVFNLRLFFLQHTGCPHEGFSSMRSSSFMRDLSSMVGGGKVGVGCMHGVGWGGVGLWHRGIVAKLQHVHACIVLNSHSHCHCDLRHNI